MQKELGNGFHVASVKKETYDEFRKVNEPLIFPNRFDINIQDALSAGEKQSTATLTNQLGAPYELRVGFFEGEKMIGWSYGVQVSGDTFRMVTSGIEPTYQRKGIYSAYLDVLAKHIRDQGFQVILSRHYATDNQVIVPKLRFGFLISGFELTDEYGLLLRLSYFFNETRRKAMHVRSGFQQPDAEVQKLIRKYV